MRFWVIAIWRTVPRKWWIVASPIALLVSAFLLWFLFAGLFAEAPVDRRAELLEQFLVKANAGDARAQYQTALILSAKKQPGGALKWLERSAENGYADAQAKLARMYAEGDGVRQNLDRAVGLYRRAGGLKQHPGAQFELGNLYMVGRGVERDLAAAVSWFRKSALGGHGDAQGKLATMYEKGFGVDRDLAEAYAWYNLAGDSENLKNLTGRMTRLELKRGKSKLKAYSRSNPVSK